MIDGLNSYNNSYNVSNDSKSNFRTGRIFKEIETTPSTFGQVNQEMSFGRTNIKVQNSEKK